MYEFDEESWDDQETEASDARGIREGWLIELANHEPKSRIAANPPQYLQIGTGQWCAANYATLFPLRGTAIVYAKEFGYRVGQSVRIVKHRF